MNILVTGGAGFIGSSLCRHLVADPANRVINLDRLTYAGNLNSLRQIENHLNYRFVQGDICDQNLVARLLRQERITRIMHLAAETHVDRSIDGPANFIETNVVGSFRLLDAALAYWRELPGELAAKFRFHHISTDEVFGDLPFDELLSSPKRPLTRPRPRIPLRRPLRIIWSAPGTRRSGCPSS